MLHKALCLGTLLFLASSVGAQEDDHAFLGITGHTLTVDEAVAYGIPGGVLLDRVIPGGAADLSGLQRGDVIVACEGQRIVHFTEMVNMIFAHDPGYVMPLIILRDGAEQALDLTLGSYLAFSTGVGLPAPPLRVDDWIGDEQSLEALEGEVVVLVFWSVQSILWKISRAQFDKLAADFDGKVRFIGVHVANEQFAKQTREAVEEYLAKTPFAGAVALASGERNMPVGADKGTPLVQYDYEFERLPAVVAVDPEGNVAFKGEGSASLSEVREVLEQLTEGEE